MNETTIPGLQDAAPSGYRFMVNLVDIADLADAKRTIREMYGERCLAVAEFKPGSVRWIRKEGKPQRWQAVGTGWRVYVKSGFRL